MKKLLLVLVIFMSQGAQAFTTTCEMVNEEDYHYTLALLANSGEISQAFRAYNIDMDSYLSWNKHDKDGDDFVKEKVIKKCSEKPWLVFLDVYASTVKERMK